MEFDPAAEEAWRSVLPPEMAAEVEDFAVALAHGVHPLREPPIEKATALVHLPRFMRVDMGIATPEEVAAEAAYWASFPVPTRWQRIRWRLRDAWHEAAFRLAVLLHGHECDS